MRASDIVRGKDSSLKIKKEEDRPLEPNITEKDLEPKRIKATYHLSDMEEELSFKPLPKDKGYSPEAAEKEPDKGEIVIEGTEEAVSGSIIPEGKTPQPKVERIEPEYRLSDFDFLNMLSAKKQPAVVETKSEEEGRSEEVSEIVEGPAATHSIEPIAISDIQREEKLPVMVTPAGGTEPIAIDEPLETKDSAMPEETEESLSPVEESIGAALAVEMPAGPDVSPSNAIKVLYKRAQSCLRNVRDQLKQNKVIDIEPAIGIIKGFIGIHYDMDAEIYQLTLNLEHDDDYFFSHAVNTAIYSLKIGQRLGYSEKQLLELGLSALLCDIGMFKIPDDILNKHGKLSSEEINLIKSHPEFTRNVLLPLKNDYPEILNAVYQHQERENGQGYPNGIKGNDISEYAKIIGICDSYEAMTHNRPHKKALVQTESIRELIGAKNQLFSPRIIKAFLDEISIFPIGSYVKLNNQNIGCVMATNRSNPLKPTIKMLYDENGRKFAVPRIIDLKAHPVLNIEGSVAPDELPA